MFAPPVLLALALSFGQPPGAAQDLPRNPTGDLGLYADPAGAADGAGDAAVPSIAEQMRAIRAREEAVWADDPAATAPVDLAGEIGGAFRAGFPVTFTLTGTEGLSETGTPNPFTDYRLTGAFRAFGPWNADDSEVTIHDDGSQSFTMPLYSEEELNAPVQMRGRLWDRLLMETSSQFAGYFAADGDAANTGATAGDKWRLQFTPPAAAERVRYRLELRRYAPGEAPDSFEQRGSETGELVAAAVGEFAVEPAPAPAPEAGADRPRDLRRTGPLISAGGRLWLAGGGPGVFLRPARTARRTCSPTPTSTAPARSRPAA